MTIERALEMLPKMRDSEWVTLVGKLTAIYTDEAKEAFNMAISALEKQEQSCDTCRHGRFGSEACINCRVGFPNHYEAEEEA